MPFNVLIGKVTLTWDETDPQREAAMKRAFDMTNKDDENDDIQAYLAMSSSEEEEGSQSNQQFSKETEENGSSYDKREEGMEMTFDDSKLQNDQNIINTDQYDTMDDKMTPWEKYLHKKKQKQKIKREARKIEHNKNDDSDSDGEPTSLKKRKHKKIEDSPNHSNDLSLLVMDSDDDKQHFDYKEIVKKESKRARKLRRKLEREKSEVEENFKVDLKDDRFSAVFQSAEFNVDPSHPNFKKTESMLAIVAEKQKRAQKRNKKSKKSNKLELDEIQHTSISSSKQEDQEANSLSTQVISVAANK